jgi:NAD(P)-dependent dehydrogenase (short-subunit alcohol dehydrogenase family)
MAHRPASKRTPSSPEWLRGRWDQQRRETADRVGRAVARLRAQDQPVTFSARRPMRKRGAGLVLWVSSSSTRGGTPPYLSPYFAAKAAMDSLAVSYASELARWGIETSIIVPGAFTKGTNHFVHAGAPADAARAAEYNDGPYAGVPEQALRGLASLRRAVRSPKQQR